MGLWNLTPENWRDDGTINESEKITEKNRAKHYSLQGPRRLEAHIHAVRGVRLQFDGLELLEALRRLHLAEHRSSLRLLPQ